MWNPIKITINNLFAHKNSVYEFKNNACTVIFGQNNTDRGLENNGAGKTTLFEAICIALTNESLRTDVKKDNFINRDEESCKIVFELYNPVMKMRLKIARQFFRSNKPVKVEIWENDELNTQITSVNEANKRVLELIGISREDLLRYFIISQDNNFTFFTANDVCKKEVMNRITSADMINPVLEELALRLKSEKDEFAKVTTELNSLESRLETLQEQKQDMLENNDTEEQIRELKKKIENEQMTKSDHGDHIERINAEIATLKKSAGEIKVQDIESLRKVVKKEKAAIERIENDITEARRIERNLKSELADTIECPNCGHEFMHQSELGLSVDEAKKLLSETQTLLKSEDAKLEVAKKKRDKARAAVDEAEKAQEKVDSIQDSISAKVRQKNRHLSEQSECDAREERYVKQIQELKKAAKDSEAIKKIDAKIKATTADVKAKREELQPIEAELDMINFWQFHMGKNGFTTFLANKSVKIIEGITNSYLRKFGVDISVIINGFKVLRSGEVREKIDVFISNNGITAESFMSHSGGERGRVTLAGVLGIQHLINLSTEGRGLNLLCFDECFHGMDSKGQENIIKIFERIGMTILVITQNVSEGFNNENTLYVVKEKGESKYISQS